MALILCGWSFKQESRFPLHFLWRCILSPTVVAPSMQIDLPVYFEQAYASSAWQWWARQSTCSQWKVISRDFRAREMNAGTPALGVDFIPQICTSPCRWLRHSLRSFLCYISSENNISFVIIEQSTLWKCITKVPCGVHYRSSTSPLYTLIPLITFFWLYIQNPKLAFWLKVLYILSSKLTCWLT